MLTLKTFQQMPYVSKLYNFQKAVSPSLFSNFGQKAKLSVIKALGLFKVEHLNNKLFIILTIIGEKKWKKVTEAEYNGHRTKFK